MVKPTKVAETAENTRKTCFFITPISSDNSDIRRTTDGLIDSVLEPLLDDLEIDLVSPHRISKPGSITSQVIKLILNSDLVIANLTTLNPNVMYELAVRHATGKQVICIAENGTHLPFDISPERTFFFKNDMMGVKELKAILQKAIPETFGDTEIDNPITREIKDEMLTDSLKKKYKGDEEDLNLIEFFTRKFDDLEKKINKSYTPPLLAEFGLSNEYTINFVLSKNKTNHVKTNKNLTDSILNLTEIYFGKYLNHESVELGISNDEIFTLTFKISNLDKDTIRNRIIELKLQFKENLSLSTVKYGITISE